MLACIDTTDKVPETERYADCFFVHPTTYFGSNYNETCKCSPGHHGNWDEMAAELTDCWVIATQVCWLVSWWWFGYRVSGCDGK